MLGWRVRLAGWFVRFIGADAHLVPHGRLCDELLEAAKGQAAVGAAKSILENPDLHPDYRERVEASLTAEEVKRARAIRDQVVGEFNAPIKPGGTPSRATVCETVITKRNGVWVRLEFLADGICRTSTLTPSEIEKHEARLRSKRRAKAKARKVVRRVQNKV